MPTRADIEAATPKCVAWPRSQLHFGGLTPVSAACTLQLRWDQAGGQWICAEHGVQVTGEIAGARMAA